MADHRADAAFRKSIHTREKSAGDTRIETDSLGSREIPADAYWGINVSRALENFPISGRSIGAWSDLVAALGWVKRASAETNLEFGVLDAERARRLPEYDMHRAEIELALGRARTTP
jgi:aspartate ammonia-lyase